MNVHPVHPALGFKPELVRLKFDEQNAASLKFFGVSRLQHGRSIQAHQITAVGSKEA
jgi:hypothetical protein